MSLFICYCVKCIKNRVILHYKVFVNTEAQFTFHGFTTGRALSVVVAMILSTDTVQASGSGTVLSACYTVVYIHILRRVWCLCYWLGESAACQVMNRPLVFMFEEPPFSRRLYDSVLFLWREIMIIFQFEWVGYANTVIVHTQYPTAFGIVSVLLLEWVGYGV